MDTANVRGFLVGIKAHLADVVEAVTGAGRLHNFPSDRGMLTVREDLQPLGHFGGTALRVRRDDATAEDFDLRLLRVSAGEGGLVALNVVEAIEREASLMTRPSSHAHAVRCHASLIENFGTQHCRLLLCDPCCGDLATRHADHGALSTCEVADVGQQLAFGLGHLHCFGILFGRIKPKGVLRGLDGFWKLADYSSATQMPLCVAQWHAEQRDREELPAELQGPQHLPLSAQTDVWFLAQLLATVALRDSASLAQGAMMVPPTALLDPTLARLWVFLHWLVTPDPAERPNVGGTASVLGTLVHTSTKELLEEMPATSRDRCIATATAAARELALNEATAASPTAQGRISLIDRLAGAPLHELRAALEKTGDFDRLCINCGIASDDDNILLDDVSHRSF